MSKYLIPTADVVFKKIFGQHPHLLRSFLNAMLPLPDGRQIESLEYLSPEQIPSIPEFKRTIVDVKCTDDQGRVFIVEMQTDWIGGFMQRMLFNSASAYVQQLKKGESYRLLCPVYGLGIIADNFELEEPSWYHHYQIVNVANPKKVIEGLELVFVELPKFKPSSKNDKYLQVLWLRFLSELNEETREVPADLLAVPEIKEACHLAEQAAYSAKELEGYNKYWDLISTAKTLAEGNFEEGFIEGALQERLKIVQKMKLSSMPLQEIASMLGLSELDVESLFK